MTSSSSSSSNIKIKSGPVDGNVLWMQDKHVSQYIWNEKENRKYHIRRIFLLDYENGILKNKCGINYHFDRNMEAETHTFHMRCEECPITLQDVSVLLGFRVDGSPLIGPTNLNWADLCGELLGVRPEEGELQGSLIKLSWLAQHFPELNNHDGNLQQVERFTHACILRFIGGVLFFYKGSSKVSLREICSVTDYKIKSIGGVCVLIQMWAWELCTSLAPKRTPPLIENKPVTATGKSTYRQ
ncbi:Serine/threonine-protein phosphatase 7 long form [Glycine soja]